MPQLPRRHFFSLSRPRKVAAGPRDWSMRIAQFRPFSRSENARDATASLIPGWATGCASVAQVQLPTLAFL